MEIGSLEFRRKSDRKAPRASPELVHETNENGERRLRDVLSPSYASHSMNLLQLSKTKVLQHFMQLQH
jgi:hypothetical protein